MLAPIHPPPTHTHTSTHAPSIRNTAHPSTDTAVPVLRINMTVPVGGAVTSGGGSSSGSSSGSANGTAIVAFPTITATDDAAGTQLAVTCKGGFLPAGSLTYTGYGEAEFRVGVTSVTCTATDDAGNTSPPVTFNVTVCAFGYSFVGGACVGGCPACAVAWGAQ